MEYSEDMTTSLQDLRAQQGNTQNLGQKIEYELDNFDYNPDIIPQTTLQKAPPMRQGQVENFPTHQTVNNSNFYPQMIPPQPPKPVRTETIKKIGLIEGLFSGIYQRILDPIIITILFMILSHRYVAKGINPFLPFVGLSPSTDFISLALRGFILSIIYLIISNYLK